MLIEILVLLLSIPIGFLIAWLAKDELLKGQKWFRVVLIASVLVGIWFAITGFPYITWTAGFISVVVLISLIRARDRKWTKIRK